MQLTEIIESVMAEQSIFLSPARLSEFLKLISAGNGTLIVSPSLMSISLYQVMKYDVNAPLTVLLGSTPKVLIGAALVISLYPPVPWSI